MLLVSGIEQSDSVTQIFILYWIIFSYRLSQNIEFPVLYNVFLSVACLICSSVIYPFPLYFPFGNCKFASDICKAVL